MNPFQKDWEEEEGGAGCAEATGRATRQDVPLKVTE